MKFTREIAEKVFKNIGKTPESICKPDPRRRFDIEVCFRDDCGCTLQVDIWKNGRIDFSTTLDYRGFFDTSDVKFFESINVTSWEIYQTKIAFKPTIEFTVKVTNEKEFEDITRKVFDQYFYH